MKQIKPVLSLEIMRQIVQVLQQGEPSTTRRKLLETLNFSITRMLEIESERMNSSTKGGEE